MFRVIFMVFIFCPQKISIAIFEATFQSRNVPKFRMTIPPQMTKKIGWKINRRNYYTKILGQIEWKFPFRFILLISKFYSCEFMFFNPHPLFYLIKCFSGLVSILLSAAPCGQFGQRFMGNHGDLYFIGWIWFDMNI